MIPAKWIMIGVLAIILAAAVCIPVTGAQPLPDYEKILQIHLNYNENGYSVSSLEVRYGTAPNINIQSGNLKGAILDSNGKEITSFSAQEPGIAYGIISGPQSENVIGYTERPAAGNMFITLPYLQNMQKFTLTDSRDGTLLVSVDLNSPVSAFCTDYPSDPDCLARIPASQSEVTDPAMTLVLAILFSSSVFLAAAIAIWTIRRGAGADTPEKQVVLIVDDDPHIVNLLETMLAIKGYTPLKASGGKEALGILEKQIPDLILLDIIMEPMDGWQTLENIKKNPNTRSVPVLMLTGKKLTAAEAKQYKLRIDDYIMKPFRSEEIYTAIAAVLTRKQKLKETLVLAKKAGIDGEKCCEFDILSRRISTNRKILDILNVPQGIPMLTDLETLDDMLVVDYINVKTRSHEKRAEQLRQEINTAFRSKGFPELIW